MTMLNRLQQLYDRFSVQRYGLNPDKVIWARGTHIDEGYKPSEYKGRLVVVGDNGNRGVVLLDRAEPVDQVGDWVDLKLLPGQSGVIITKLDGRKETYTSDDKRFIEALVTSWSHKKGIDE